MEEAQPPKRDAAMAKRRPVVLRRLDVPSTWRIIEVQPQSPADVKRCKLPVLVEIDSGAERR